MKTRIILIALLTTVLNAAYCGIEWKSKEISIEVKPGQGSIEVPFEFSITGNDSIAVISTKTSCSCVTVDDILGEHKPGTKGTFKVRYVPRQGGAGTTVERITVQTTDPKAPEVELRLLIYAPLSYRIEPSYVFWNVGGEANAKDVYLVDITGKGYKPVAIYSSSVNITATLIPPSEKSSRYVIRIKPVSTAEVGGGYVYLDVDMGDGTIEKRRIIAAIRNQNDSRIKIDQ